MRCEGYSEAWRRRSSFEEPHAYAQHTSWLGISLYFMADWTQIVLQEPFMGGLTEVRNTAQGEYTPQSANKLCRRYRADCQRQVQASSVRDQRRRRRLASAYWRGPMAAPQIEVAPAATWSIGLSPPLAIIRSETELRKGESKPETNSWKSESSA